MYLRAGHVMEFYLFTVSRVRLLTARINRGKVNTFIHYFTIKRLECSLSPAYLYTAMQGKLGRSDEIPRVDTSEPKIYLSNIYTLLYYIRKKEKEVSIHSNLNS